MVSGARQPEPGPLVVTPVPGRDGLAAAERRAGVLAWSAGLAIGLALLIMIAISALGHSAAVAALPRPAAGPPWSLAWRLSPETVIIALWGAAVLGCAGVITGLAAIARGARLPSRLLVAGAMVAVAALTVLPPGGSTDVVSYAIDGRIVVTGHSPYVTTPGQLRATGDPVARFAPPVWVHQLSIYGPLATAEEWAAAELGGTSVARIAFWLKLWNALAFSAVVLALDRMLRSRPAMRARAHLLWSVNPLLLWAVIAGGHVDGLAAALGFGGLAVLRIRPTGSASESAAVSPGRAFAAGLLAGAATACKVPFVLFGAGIVWACRRSPAALAGSLCGFFAVLLPGYVIAGWPAVKALTARTQGTTVDNFYQLLYPPFRSATATSSPSGLVPVAAGLVVFLAVVALWRLPHPAEFTDLPAVRPALALSLAWLFAWPFQRPWYDVMIVCLLVLYPASRFDGVVMARLLAGTTVFILASDQNLGPHWLSVLFSGNSRYLAPAVRLAAVAALTMLCLRGRWWWRRT